MTEYLVEVAAAVALCNKEHDAHASYLVWQRAIQEDPNVGDTVLFMAYCLERLCSSALHVLMNP